MESDNDRKESLSFMQSSVSADVMSVLLDASRLFKNHLNAILTRQLLKGLLAGQDLLLVHLVKVLDFFTSLVLLP